ncbi:MAG: DUF2254 domain-containing protein [Sphingomicrobium sp.]
MKQPASEIVSSARWWLHRMSKRIWVRASMFCLGGVAVALLAAIIGPHLPYDPKLTLASGSVGMILNILATSMLAVTTFSLSIMVSAYSSATSNVTPRSTNLLLSDSIAQNTLSTFIGTFLFSIVGIIGIASGFYDGKGRILLFFATIVVIVLVVATLLRWIEQLGRFGRVGDTIRRVEKATAAALQAEARHPRMGALDAVAIPKSAGPMPATKVGHVQHIDVIALENLAMQHGVTIHLQVTAGSLVHPARSLAWVDPAPDDILAKEIRACFSIGVEREFDHDSRFGIVVLGEIASRALSPGINDPGTAIEVADSGLRLFMDYAAALDGAKSPSLKRVHAPGLDLDEMTFSFFNPISRDGASIVEVQQRLLVVLAALADRHPKLFGKVARAQAAAITERARGEMPLKSNYEMIEKSAAEKFGL